MSINNILIGNANTFSLVNFSNALTSGLENDVSAFASVCYSPPTTGGGWIVQNATDTTPIVITSQAHGLSTNDYITIVNVGDDRGAHGTFQVTVIDADNFSLNGSVGSANWSVGGQFYKCVQDCAGLAFALQGNGLYQLTINGNVGLIPNSQYVFVVYCTGAYRDLYNSVNPIVAQVRTGS